MNKRKLRIVWETLEKVIAYCALFVVIVLQLLDIFFPSLNISSVDFSLGLIASSLLVIFAHVEDVKKDVSTKDFGGVSTRFNDGLLDVFSKNKHIKSLDIMAHTTKTYIHSISDNDITIERVRILVCKPKDSTSRQYPDKDSISRIDDFRNQAVESWKDLVKIGKIKKLEIKYYEFDPTFHIAIINEQFFHYGLYKIEHKFPGYHLYKLYTINGSDSELAHSLLNDFQSFFIHIFEEFSYQDETCNIE